MLGQTAHGELALAVGPRVHARVDGAVYEVRDHLSQQIGSDQSHVARAPSRCQRAADGQAVDRVDVDSRKIWNVLEQLARFAEALLGVLMGLNRCRHGTAAAELRKTAGE